MKFLENLAIGLGNSVSDIAETIEILKFKRGVHGAVLDEHIDWAISRLMSRALENESGNA